MSQQNEYKKIYLQESGELLQQMNKNLLILEKQPKNTEALNAIFRAAHTLKSMAASMGDRDIADLSHKMEDVLDELRSAKIIASEEVINLLFKSFDCLEVMAGAIREDKKITADIQPLIASLDKFILKGPQITEENISEGLSLNKFEKKTLARVKKEGLDCYHIKVILDKDCVLKSVRAFMVFRNLHAIGEVVKSIPDSQLLEEEKFGLEFYCIFISKEKPGIVKKKVMEILDVEKVEIHEIKIEPSWEKELLEDPFIEAQKMQELALGPGEGMRKIQSVRVDINRLDKLMNLVEELAISKLRLAEVGIKIPDVDLKTVIEELGRLTDDLQAEVMQARLVPVSQVFDRFPRLVRDLAKKEGKLVKFDIIGGDIELDRTILDEIGDPLIHILKNSIDHGIEVPSLRKEKGKPEEGRIMLSARREKSHVFIEVEDDGKGMNIEEIKKAAIKRGLARDEEIKSMTSEQILLLTTLPGFSTKEEVSDVSGRGVGLDVANEKSESLGGSLLIESVSSKGTKVTMRLPITTAVVQALLVQIFNRTFAIPISSVTEIIVVEENSIKTIEGKEAIMHRNKVLPVVRLGRLFSVAANRHCEEERSDDEAIFKSEITSDAAHPRNDKNTNNVRLNIVIVEFGAKQYGIVVEKLLMQQDIVIKQLTKELKGVRGFAGATILGDGSVALVLDVATLI